MDFQAAASSGDVSAVRALLEDGIVVTQNWHMTRPPLCLAAGNGHTKVVRLLIGKGKFDPGDVDARDRTALSWASGRGHKKVVKCLLERADANTEAADEDGWTALSWASANGFAAVARMLLEKGANVTSKDRCGRTPLSWASSNGHKDVVKTLLAAQKELDVERDVDKKKRTPFLRAAAMGKKEHVEIMKRILAKDRTCLDVADRDKRTPLSWAAGAGHVKATQFLLKEKVKLVTIDEYDRTPLSWAAERGHEKVVAMLLDEDSKSQHPRSTFNSGVNAGVNTEPLASIKDRKGQAPILYAAIYGHDKVVQLLIGSGTSSTDAADSEGRTPLSWAAGEGHDIVVDALLTFGNVEMNKRDNEGETALSWAAKKGHRRVVWTLSRHQTTIEPNHARLVDKRTALSLAAARGLHAVVRELLLIKHIDKDAKDSKGQTALMLAYEGGHEKTMKFLIQGGADLEIRSPGNMTILMLAAKTGNATLVQHLIDHGADFFAVNAKDKTYDKDPGFTAIRYAYKEKHKPVIERLKEHLNKARKNKKQAAQIAVSAAQDQGVVQTSAPASVAPLPSRPQTPTISGPTTPLQLPQATVAQTMAGPAATTSTSTMETQTTKGVASSSQNAASSSQNEAYPGQKLASSNHNPASSNHNATATYMQSNSTPGALGQALLAAAAQAPGTEVQQIQAQPA